MSTTVLERTDPRDDSDARHERQRSADWPRGLAVTAWVLAFGAVIVVAAGFAPAVEQRSGDTRLYSLGARHVDTTSAVRGTVALTRDGCVGLETGDETLAVIWPASTVLVSETAMRMPDGEVIRVGDRVVLSASRVPGDPDLGILSYACGAGDAVLLISAGAS